MVIAGSTPALLTLSEDMTVTPNPARLPSMLIVSQSASQSAKKVEKRLKLPLTKADNYSIMIDVKQQATTQGKTKVVKN